jgi:hypothetical protein
MASRMQTGRILILLLLVPQVLAWTLDSAVDDARSELETIVASFEGLR